MKRVCGAGSAQAPSRKPNRTTPALLAALLALIGIVPGCKQSSSPVSHRREITRQITLAAQQAAGKGSRITIRPETRAAPPPGPQVPVQQTQLQTIDHIYIALGYSSALSSTEAAVLQVARRYGLEAARKSLGPRTVAFEYRQQGHPTHVIEISLPGAMPARIATSAKLPPGAAKLAIIMDDLGNDRAPAEALLRLPFPLTFSVLPGLIHSTDIAQAAHRRGDEVLLHMPMAALGGAAKMEPVELHSGMGAQEVDRILSAMLESVPGAAGVNNHQGSLSTADPQLMSDLMSALRHRGLIFVDSRTSAETVAYEAAERAGVPAAFRKVFLDDTPARADILAQLALAERDALRDGWAIAIGHPRPQTIAVLRAALPQAQRRGVHLVFASELAR